MSLKRSGITTWNGHSDAGINTFVRTPLILDPSASDLREKNVRAAVMGVPCDGGTMSRTGSSMGPRAIRNASHCFSPFHGDYDSIPYIEILQVHDCGDCYVHVGDNKKTIRDGADMAAEIYKAGAMPVILGGEHTVSLCGAMGLQQANPDKKYGFIHLDGHLDNNSETEEWHHGSQFRWISELDAFPCENMVAIGMRGTTNFKHSYEFCESRGISVYTMRRILKEGLENVIDDALKIANSGTDGFYLSIDLDVLEPAHVPGAEDPTPFGLTVRELWQALPKLGGSESLVGFDVVELVPNYDPSNITAITAAAIIVELLAFKAAVVQEGIN